MMQKPFLTIGIASYNYSEYLIRAFEQIKKQEFHDYEVLYCDDGSTDGSVEIIESFIEKNPDMQIRLIKGENRGLLANRNRILENAIGEYLLICDADDYMSDDCLESLCSAAKGQEADCVIGGFCEVDRNGKEYKFHIPREDSNKWIYIWHHAQMYRLEIVRKHNLRFENIPDDVCFLQRIHQYANKTVFVPKRMYYWCRHADSTSGNIVQNTEWHPKNLWRNIVDCILAILKDNQEGVELGAIHYFLYKWFYFNITDLSIQNRTEMTEHIKSLKWDMKKICPEYRKFYFLKQALKEKDTSFAKTAIILCWILEGIGCIKLLPIIRSMQQGRRR